jgi:hypothetical protein
MNVMTNARLVVKKLVTSQSVAALVQTSQSPITANGTVTTAQARRYGAQANRISTQQQESVKTHVKFTSEGVTTHLQKTPV